MDRTSARVAAMKLLYEWEMGGGGGDDTLALMDIEPGENETEYMHALVAGVKAASSRLDQAISGHLTGWKLDRLRRVDLTILRLAAYEMLEDGLSAAVAINEAIEMARTFSTPEAGGFINGVLGALAREYKL
ncbi:MAG: transcription antitermination factor NusB [Clostridiales bacterium]|nr:transcription antitermination factor NusB [Clostridiales bacterium]